MSGCRQHALFCFGIPCLSLCFWLEASFRRRMLPRSAFEARSLMHWGGDRAADVIAIRVDTGIDITVRLIPGTLSSTAASGVLPLGRGGGCPREFSSTRVEVGALRRLAFKLAVAGGRRDARFPTPPLVRRNPARFRRCWMSGRWKFARCWVALPRFIVAGSGRDAGIRAG